MFLTGDSRMQGRDCHTGSTPFSARSDAMLCAAQCIVASNRLAKEFGALASTVSPELSPRGLLPATRVDC